MNEIQAVKTAKIEEVKKNSKKGFTLVELVVVIAILAILAAIAIPVVSSTITSSQRSSAKSNAQTIETAIKEADAAISAKDDTVFVDKSQNGGFKASSGSLTLANVSKAKAIDSAVTATYQINGVNYSAYYDNDTQKVAFLGHDGTNVVDVDGNKYAGTKVVLLTDSNGGVDASVKFNGTGKASGKTEAAPSKGK
ncbi:prepilin-type N-terminal cleavage/methylation domain-containing protein [Ruminococcus sp.]